MSSSSNAVLLRESLGITPELSPIADAHRYIGLNVMSIKRLEATDPEFPPLIRLSPKKVLVDIPATAAYLRAQAGKAPRSIRGDAERTAVAPAAKPRNVRRGGA